MVKKMWILSSSKSDKLKVSESIKNELTKKGNNLIESVLKPRHIKVISENESFNYIIDLYSKWYRNYFYFCAKYASPSANSISPTFETKFARMEYIGKNSFNISYMRHTNKWFEIYSKIEINEALRIITEDPHFMP